MRKMEKFSLSKNREKEKSTKEVFGIYENVDKEPEMDSCTVEEHLDDLQRCRGPLDTLAEYPRYPLKSIAFSQRSPNTLHS